MVLIHQAKKIEVWTKLEQARELVSSCRSAAFFPDRRDTEDAGGVTCDAISQQIAELRNWVYSQMGGME